MGWNGMYIHQRRDDPVQVGGEKSGVTVQSTTIQCPVLNVIPCLI